MNRIDEYATRCRAAAGCCTSPLTTRYSSSRLWFITFGIFIVLGSLLWDSSCFGQGAGGDQAQAIAQKVRQLEPNLYYVEDSSGRLIPVPGFRYRDFVDLVRLRDGLPAQPEVPGLILEQLRIKVVLPAISVSDVTHATVDLECVVRSTRPGWGMLPLKLPELVITEPPTIIGEGEVVVTIDPLPVNRTQDGMGNRSKQYQQAIGYHSVSDKGFLIWVNEKDGATVTDTEEMRFVSKRHTVTMSGQIPVDVSLDRDQLDITLPAATDSKILIETQRRNPVVNFNAGVITPTVQVLDGQSDAVGSVVEIRGAVGATRVQLEEPLLGKVPVRKLAESMVKSIVRVDGRLANIKAEFALANLSPDENTFTVQLPPRSVLLSVGSNAKILSRSGSSLSPRTVLRIDQAVGGKASFEIVCERSVDSASLKPIDVGGFSIDEIPKWRQWGRVSVFADDDWTVEWESRSGNRQIDAPAALSTEEFVAAFAYDSQPMTLPLRVRARRSRLVVEPEYLYHVTKNRLELSVRLQAVIRGVAAKQLKISLPNWDVEEIGPSSVVDSAAVSESSGSITVPFLKPMAGEVVVELRCSRRIDSESEVVSWKTPAPEADFVGPARVGITSESNIELVPDTERIVGMSRQVSSQAGKPVADLSRMSYRVEANESTFVGTRRILDQQIEASITAQVDVGLRQIVVQQATRIDVAHVPLQFIEWMVPESLIETGSIEARFDGVLLTPEVISSPSGITEFSEGKSDDGEFGENVELDSSEPPWRVVRVLLPGPLLGAGELVSRFKQSTPEIPEEVTVPVSVPILLPKKAVVGRQSVTLSSVEELAVGVRDELWNREGNLQTIGLGRTWNTSQGQATIDLTLTQNQKTLLGETVIEATWLRTTLRGSMRSDYWAMAVTSASDSLAITLPLLAENEAGEVKGNQIARARVNSSSWKIADEFTGKVELDLGQSRGTHLIEVEVRQPRKENLLPGMDWLEFQSPGMPSSALYGRVVWEVLVPDRSSLLWGPRGWTSQQVWDWSRSSFRQIPAVSVQNLASWVTASANLQVDLPRRLGVDTLFMPRDFIEHRMVFCDAGSPANVSCFLIPRWLLILASSGIPLVAGVVLTLRPRLTTAALVLAAVFFIAGMAIWPTVTFCILQASLPGLAFAVPAGAVSWWRVLLKNRTQTAYDLESWETRPSGLKRSRSPESLVINMRSSTEQTAVPVTSSQARDETD